MPRQNRIKSCKSDHCWLVAQDFSAYCKIHLKMIQSKAFILIQDMRTRLGPRWPDFVNMMRSKADPEDPEQLFVEEFQKILSFFKIKLSATQL